MATILHAESEFPRALLLNFPFWSSKRTYERRGVVSTGMLLRFGWKTGVTKIRGLNESQIIAKCMRKRLQKVREARMKERVRVVGEGIRALNGMSHSHGHFDYRHKPAQLNAPQSTLADDSATIVHPIPSRSQPRSAPTTVFSRALAP